MSEDVSQMSDSELLELCTKRLLATFKRRFGVEFKYGRIVLVIHEGGLVQIEENPTYRSFARGRAAARSDGE